MQALGVDLAERYSAAVLLDPEGRPLYEGIADFGKAEKPARPQKHFEAIEKFALELCTVLQEHPAAVWVEDLAARMVNPKPAVRAQAILCYILHRELFSPELVMATTWQRELGYKKKPGVTSKGWAKVVCAELGYVPAEELAGGKSSVDLRDAYLMARWAQGLRRSPIDTG